MVSEERETNDRSSPNLSRLGSMGLKLQGWRSLLMIWLVWLGLCVGIDHWAQTSLRQVWTKEVVYGLERNASGSIRRLKASIDFVEFLSFALAAESGQKRSAEDAQASDKELAKAFLHSAHIFDELLILDAGKTFQSFQPRVSPQSGLATPWMRKLYQNSLDALAGSTKQRFLVQGVSAIKGDLSSDGRLMVLTAVPQVHPGSVATRLVVAKIRDQDLLYPKNSSGFEAFHPFGLTSFVCSGAGSSALLAKGPVQGAELSDWSCNRFGPSLMAAEKHHAAHQALRLGDRGLVFAKRITSDAVASVDGFGRQALKHDLLMDDWWMVVGASEKQLHEATFALLLVPRLFLIASFIPVGYGFFLITSLRRKRQLALRQLRYRAIHDPLTGLPDRGEVYRRIQALMLGVVGRSKGATLILIDVDNFKDINDSLGHIAGDKVICNVSKRINSLMRSDSFVGRLGGDELIALLPGVALEASALKRANEIRKACSLPVELDAELSCRITVSLGVAVLGVDRSVDEWITRADQALYRAKSGGRNCVASRHGVYVPQCEERITADADADGSSSPELELLDGGAEA